MPLLATPFVLTPHLTLNITNSPRYPHVLNSINSPAAPRYTFMVFYSSVVGGQMWCPVSRADASQATPEMMRCTL
jgi:hypothetical protein